MKIEYVDTQSHLEIVISKLAGCSSVAIDLEFDKNHYRYGFNLCLIQLFDGEQCFLIDPIDTKLDLTSLFSILSNQKIEKICFAFGEDMRLLHHLGCTPKNINDLGNARSLLNYPPLSLSNLLKETLAIEADKTMQKSNWFKRPLSKEQIKYAADDVLYLFALKEILYAQLKEKNRIEWVDQENAAFDTVSYPEQIGVVNVKNSEKKMFTSYDFHVYEGLLKFREKTAERIGKPSYQIIKKEILAEIARGKLPTHNWQKQKGVFRSLLNKDYQYRIDAEHRRLISEADILRKSKTACALEPLDRATKSENRRKRAEAERVKKEIYTDIKENMINRYGAEFATFVMPNHVMLSLAAKEFSHILPYRLQLIKELGKQIGKEVNY